jgi:hypothetical protein
LTQQELIERVALELADLRELKALFVGGSYGSGTADPHSDVDLIALAESADTAAVAARWRQLLERIDRVVFWNELGRGPILLNAITQDWLRCDMLVMTPPQFVGRAKTTVRPLVDKIGCFEALPPALAPRVPDPQRVLQLVNEFIRVMGLLTVVVGRGEYFMAATGAGMLRDCLMKLMLEEVPHPTGGALHPRRTLPAADMAILDSLPFPGPERNAVIDAHFAIARVFFPRAGVLAASLGFAWPESFEAATLAHLRRAFANEWVVSW